MKGSRDFFWILILILLSQESAWAESTTSKALPSLSEKLEAVRSQKVAIENSLIEDEKTKRTAEAQIFRLKALQKLQRQEKQLTQKRLNDLEHYLEELRSRKEDLQKKIDEKVANLRVKFSKLVHPLLYQGDQFLRGDENEGTRRLKENILSSVALYELKELEGLHADFQDAGDIENRIEQEKQHIHSIAQDISEQESLIEFHQKLREELTREKKSERLNQLREYQKLKSSEIEIERMVVLFQERQKLEHQEDQKKRSTPMLLRPKSLIWPLKGKLVGTFGQRYDERTGLNIFRKGIEILTMNDVGPVMGVLDGKVQYAGEIPGKGRVMILEHPRALYTIYSGLSEMLKKVGDEVKASEKLGSVVSESPLYFEIRAHNVAIDPLKWLQ